MSAPVYDFSKCPRCGSKTVKAESWSGNDSTFWLTCVSCNTYIDTYRPQEHQYMLHEDTHRIKGNFGGYGSGKTLTDQKEVAKHLFITQNANVVVGANVSSQYEQTIKREMENDLPSFFVERVSVQDKYMDFKNGARLMWRSLDDPGKLRSLNLSMYLIIEGSESTNEVFTQLNTRLRNTNAIIYETDSYGNKVEYLNEETGKVSFKILHDWRQGIIESNPDSGYIRTDILMVSDKIHQFGLPTDAEVYDQDENKIDSMISSYVTATRANKYLPDDYEDTFKNRPTWWKRRYLKGSFQFAEGLVYPEYFQAIVDPFEIPDHWLRMIAFDYGLSDRAVFAYGAIDPEKGVVYIYKAPATENMDIEGLANIYSRESSDIPQGGLAFPPIIDPKSGPKRDYQKRSLIDRFHEYGIHFEPGVVSVETRIMQMNAYIRTGKLKIFSTCTELINELRDYKFPEKTLDNVSSRNLNKPVDKNNHSINPVEWIVCRLPRDPKNLLMGVYNYEGVSYDDYEEKQDKKSVEMWQFADDDTNFYSSDGFQTPDFNIFNL